MKNDLFIACGCLYFCLFCFTSCTNRKRVITVNFPALIIYKVTFTLIFQLGDGSSHFCCYCAFWWCLGLVSNHPLFLFRYCTVKFTRHKIWERKETAVRRVLWSNKSPSTVECAVAVCAHKVIFSFSPLFFSFLLSLTVLGKAFFCI